MDITESTLSGDLLKVVRQGIEANTRNLVNAMTNKELSYDEKDIALRGIDAQSYMLDVLARIAAADITAAAMDRQTAAFSAEAAAARTGR